MGSCPPIIRASSPQMLKNFHYPARQNFMSNCALNGRPFVKYPILKIRAFLANFHIKTKESQTQWNLFYFCN